MGAAGSRRWGALALGLLLLGGLGVGGWLLRRDLPVLLLLVPGSLAETQTWCTDQEGTFLREFTTVLQQQGRHVEIVTIGWGGGNTHQARLDGGRQLVATLNGLQRHGEVVVVTHSHGGSVLGLALADPTLTRRVDRAFLLACPILVTELRSERHDAPPRSALLYFAPDVGEHGTQLISLHSEKDRVQTLIAGGLDGVTRTDLQHSEVVAAWCRFHSGEGRGTYSPGRDGLVPGGLVQARRTLDLPGVLDVEVRTDLPFTLNPITEHAVLHSLVVARHLARVVGGEDPAQVLSGMPVLTDPGDQGDALPTGR